MNSRNDVEGEEVLDDLSGASIELLKKMIQIYSRYFGKENVTDMEIFTELSESMNRFGPSISQFEYDMDEDICTKFNEIREKVKIGSLDFAKEELDQMDFDTFRQRSSIHPNRTKRIMEEESNKQDALKNVLKLRYKYEALFQLKYFLKDIETGKTINMEKYLQKKK